MKRFSLAILALVVATAHKLPVKSRDEPRHVARGWAVNW